MTENLRVAIIAKSSRQRLNLKSILESNDLDVVPDEELYKFVVQPASQQIADVLLVDLDEADEKGVEALEVLMEKTQLPVLFNDSAGTRNKFSTGGLAWGKRLANKLIDLATSKNTGRIIDHAPFGQPEVSGSIQSNKLKEKTEEIVASTSIDLSKYRRKLASNRTGEYDSFTINKPVELKTEQQKKEKSGKVKTRKKLSTVIESKQVPIVKNTKSGVSAKALIAKARRKAKDRQAMDADSVWVLGASIGGPQAVKEFLSCLPADLPIAFILAQHIGSGFVPLLAEQLDRISNLDVSSPRSGLMLQNSQLVVSPVKQRLSFDVDGKIKLKAIVQKTTYTPSIDKVLIEVARRYGKKAGAIIFSGMGNDGVNGIQAVAHNGGVIWAQDSDSCVISSMADHARLTGLVQFSADPAGLAKKLVGYLS